MQRNNQKHEQFLREFGALVTAHTRHGHVGQPQQPLLHLADYVSSARRHHCLSRALLAQKTGKAEAEIYALEQGLLSYDELDLRFLHKLALALDEDLETLLLLLGRPALVHTLPAHLLHRPHAATSGLPTTKSQPSGNWRTLHWWFNHLVKGSLNLIDFPQEGRLFAGIMRGRATSLLATLAVCLLFIWVSHYSLSSSFDAQSTLQAYTSLSTAHPGSPANQMLVGQVPASQVMADLDAASSTSAPTSERLYQPWPPRSVRIAKMVAKPADEWQFAGMSPATLAFLALPTTDPAVQCDLRTVGRFALCRM